jgi:hypothetical protein
MAARRRRGLDSESADRAIINVTAMRVVVGHCPRDQVPDFTADTGDLQPALSLKSSGHNLLLSHQAGLRLFRTLSPRKLHYPSSLEPMRPSAHAGLGLGKYPCGILEKACRELKGNAVEAAQTGSPHPVVRSHRHHDVGAAGGGNSAHVVAVEADCGRSWRSFCPLGGSIVADRLRALRKPNVRMPLQTAPRQSLKSFQRLQAFASHPACQREEEHQDNPNYCPRMSL